MFMSRNSISGQNQETLGTLRLLALSWRYAIYAILYLGILEGIVSYSVFVRAPNVHTHKKQGLCRKYPPMYYEK